MTRPTACTKPDVEHHAARWSIVAKSADEQGQGRGSQAREPGNAMKWDDVLANIT